MFLQHRDDMECVGQAADQAAARTLLAELKPDVAVVDLALGAEDGLEIVRSVRSLSPATRSLVFTMHEEREYVRAALLAGADGYALKRGRTTEVLDAIRRVMSGDRYLDPALGDATWDSYLIAPLSEQRLAVLTPREVRSSSWSRAASPTARSPSSSGSARRASTPTARVCIRSRHQHARGAGRSRAHAQRAESSLTTQARLLPSFRGVQRRIADFLYRIGPGDRTVTSRGEGWRAEAERRGCAGARRAALVFARARKSAPLHTRVPASPGAREPARGGLGSECTQGGDGRTKLIANASQPAPVQAAAAEEMMVYSTLGSLLGTREVLSADAEDEARLARSQLARLRSASGFVRRCSIRSRRC